MKRSKGKTISTVLVVSMIISLSGCSNKSNKVEFDENSINIMAPLNGSSEPKEDCQIKKAIEEFTGENININWVTNGSYKEISTVLIAGGNCPDVYVVENITTDIISGVEQGAFWDITDYLGDYPNLKNYNSTLANNSSFNGRTYGLYRYKSSVNNCLLIRQDWLNNLGIEVPKSIDDLQSVLVAFKENDPDGDGKDDTFGLGVIGANGNDFANTFEQMSVYFGAANKWKLANDVLTPNYLQEEYRETLEFFKYLYDNEILDPDFALRGADDVKNGFIDGKYGVILTDGSTAKEIEEAIEKEEKKVEDIVCTAVSLSKDGEDHLLPQEGFSGIIMFPKKAVESEEELRKILSFFDKLNSEEGYKLLNYGIEGQDYSIKNGEIEVIKSDNTYDLLSFAGLSSNWNQYKFNSTSDGKLMKELRRQIDEAKDNEVENPTECLRIEDVIADEATFQSKIEQLKARYIFGTISKDEYNVGIEDLLNKEANKYIDEVNEDYQVYISR